MELEQDQRAAFLDQACDGDASLRREVESLIASHEDERTFLAGPAFEVVAQHKAEEGVLSASQQIGHYRVISQLGKGGMGEVYLAQDTNALGSSIRAAEVIGILPPTVQRGWRGQRC